MDSRSAADARAAKILGDTTYHDRYRYQVGMFWAEDGSSLPKNYISALDQLKLLKHSLAKDADLKERFTRTIQDDFPKGYIVNFDKVNCWKVNEVCNWYLSHHSIVHHNKPGKFRQVLNCAAKFQGQTLNNLFLTGPDLHQNLIHILIRFRQHPHAVSADIERLFLQVGVIPDDRPSLRFLWRDGPTSEIAVIHNVCQICGSKDSPTCAIFALRRTNSN